MIATFTPDQLTPFSFEDAAKAMRAALASQLGGTAPESALALVLAKTALETGRWQKIHAYNWGNIKASPKYEGMFTSFACDEILPNRGRVWFEPDGREKDSKGWTRPTAYDVPPGHPQTRFRAYANKYDGAYQYVDFIAAGRYRDAWAELLEGDAVGYVHALKLKNYFTADETKYRTAVVSLTEEMKRRLDGIEVPEPAVDWQFDAILADVQRLQHGHLEALLRGDYDSDTEPPPTDPDPNPPEVA